jgi:hypothetical protein
MRALVGRTLGGVVWAALFAAGCGPAIGQSYPTHQECRMVTDTGTHIPHEECQTVPDGAPNPKLQADKHDIEVMQRNGAAPAPSGR